MLVSEPTRTCTSFRLRKSYNNHIVGASTVNTSDFSTSWIKCSLQSFDSHFSNLPSNFWVIIFLLRRFLNRARIFSWYYIQEFQSLERPLINQSPLGLVNECLRADSPGGESYTRVSKPLGLSTCPPVHLLQEEPLLCHQLPPHQTTLPVWFSRLHASAFSVLWMDR